MHLMLHEDHLMHLQAWTYTNTRWIRTTFQNLIITPKDLKWIFPSISMYKRYIWKRKVNDDNNAFKTLVTLSNPQTLFCEQEHYLFSIEI